MLKAMLEELDRSMSQLQLPGFAKPFFIQYRIEDVDDFSTKAEFGASEGSQRTHERVARVTVRVGDYKTDSSGGRGDGALELAALDDDPIALRSALWSATDTAYKSALAAYAQKQAALKQVQTPPQADDFSHEKPLISLAEPAELKVDEDAWTQRVAQASGLYRNDAAARPDEGNVQYSTAEFHGRVDNHLAGDERRNHRAQVGAGVSGSVCRGHAGGRMECGWTGRMPRRELAQGSGRA